MPKFAKAEPIEKETLLETVEQNENKKEIEEAKPTVSSDEAFEELEVMKKHYFWESTSEAYLSLCDLIRRRYIN